MKYVRISPELGIVVRRKAIHAAGLTEDLVTNTLGFDSPMDLNEDILSFGPIFGGEAADEFIRRLSVLGLSYVDDFFLFSGDFPEWCRFGIALNSSE